MDRSGNDGTQPFQPVRPSRQYQAVVEQIEAAIFSGRYKSGDRFPPERELCLSMNVSRIALREALRVLQHKGLIVVRPGNGGGAYVRNAGFEPVHQAFLTQLKLEAFGHADLFQAKDSLEPVIVAVAASACTPDDIKALRENIHTMRGSENEARAALSYEFNRLLGLATHNNFLAQIMVTMADLLRHIGLPELPVALWEQVMVEHEAMVDAMAAHDADQARRITEAHVRTVRAYHIR